MSVVVIAAVRHMMGSMMKKCIDEILRAVLEPGEASAHAAASA